MNELMYKISLSIHVVSGMVAFVMAPLALATVKGGRWHRFWGKVYFWMMATVASSGILLAAFGPRTSMFLVLVGVFGFYLAFSAYRVLYRKRPLAGAGPTWLDWAGSSIAALGGLALLLAGVLRPTREFQHMGTVAIVFGGICLLSAGEDMHKYLRPSTDKNFWWYDHLSGMIASYIAALTAFTVVNARNFNLPPKYVWIPWLLPTIIGTPVIIAWTAYYRRKFAARKAAAV